MLGAAQLSKLLPPLQQSKTTPSAVGQHSPREASNSVSLPIENGDVPWENHREMVALWDLNGI